MISMFFALSLVAAQTDAAAPPPAAPAMVETAAEKREREKLEKQAKVVCKRYLPTGSSLPMRDCKTNAEWDAQAREAKESAQRIQQDNNNLFRR
jgi:hypothetical protein